MPFLFLLPSFKDSSAQQGRVKQKIKDSMHKKQSPMVDTYSLLTPSSCIPRGKFLKDSMCMYRRSSISPFFPFADKETKRIESERVVFALCSHRCRVTRHVIPFFARQFFSLFSSHPFFFLLRCCSPSLCECGYIPSLSKQGNE